MDQQAFRDMLEARNIPIDEIDRTLTLAERFDEFLVSIGEKASRMNAGDFAKVLIEEGCNQVEDFVALARYAYFIKSNGAYLTFLEILDGAEVPQNLYKKVAERYGEAVRDELFGGISIPPLGIPAVEKPGYVQPVIQKIEAQYGSEECRDFLADSLRDLPEESFLHERKNYHDSRDIDEFLAGRRQRFIDNLRELQRAGRPFFTQEVTEDVIEFVESSAEIGGGMRDGNIVYETKIPYMTKEYLAEEDDVRKRYYYCHCPWARETILSGESMSPIFCNCSAGYHKRPWEVIFERPIKAEVLENVLQGDQRCRFAIHLPLEAKLPR